MSAQEAAAAAPAKKGKAAPKEAAAEAKPVEEPKFVPVIPPFMGISNNRKCMHATLKDVTAEDFIEAYAKHLKASGKLVPPAWAEYCKTGTAKELAPTNPDWYYVRAASLARRMYLSPAGTGVGALRKEYSCKKRKGVRPPRHAIAAGGLLRKMLIQLEAMKIVEKARINGRVVGRRLTSQGRCELDQIAKQVFMENREKPIRF